MSALREWSVRHKLGLALASVASTVVFGTLILVAGTAGFAYSVAYIAVLATLSVLLRLA